MKALMIVQHANFFRNLDTVIRELDRRGHEIVFLHGTPLHDPKTQRSIARKREQRRLIWLARGIELAEGSIRGLSTGYRPEPGREERWHTHLRSGRLLVNRSLYLRKKHPASPRSVEAVDAQLAPGAQRLLRFGPTRALMRSRLFLRVWRLIERASPPSPTATRVLREVDPDVVLVSPMVWPKAPVEADYIHAARRLGLPTVGYMNSWDNLTSKGTIHALPDAFIVWNDALSQEAAELHSVSRRRLRITGAPHFDYFFSLEASDSHAAICARMGCPDDRPYVLYLCSSRTLIASETHIGSRLAEALSRRLGDNAPTVVVRPHPVNPQAWDGYDHPGIVVHPDHGDQADTPEAWQAYFDQLTSASCCFGLNTTAFLEAVVADRPCLTVVADEFADAQGRTGHFRHIEAGGFLEAAADMDDAAARIERVLSGTDRYAAQRRAFAESFVRPAGLERRASSVVVDVLESAAGFSDRRRGTEMVPVARAAAPSGPQT